VNPRQLLDELPDDALLPVAFVRELLAQNAVDDSDPLADLSVQDAAKVFDREPSTIRAWCASGSIQAYKLNSREWRIPREALRAYQDRQREKSLDNEKSKSFRAGRAVDLGAWRKVRGVT
jgi:excisionase family DNA binding protein